MSGSIRGKQKINVAPKSQPLLEKKKEEETILDSHSIICHKKEKRKKKDHANEYP